MPRLGLGLGLNLPRPIFIGGGGSPSVPVGALATYTAYSPSNFTLVTGDSVNVWNDETTNANDLTQSTSGNQPVLVEDNTVTQFTASDQPSYEQVSGINVLRFAVDSFLNGLPIAGTSDFTLELTVTPNGIPTSNFASSSSTLARVFTQGGVGSLRLISDAGTALTIGASGSIVDLVENKILISRTGNSLTAWNNGTELNTVDVTGLAFTLDRLGRTSQALAGDYSKVRYWDSAVADPVNPTETPTQTLTPDSTKMRTSANANPVLGEDVAKWYADEWSGYRDNHVLFDPVKYMEGLTAQAGDFTYIFKYQDDDQATAGAIVSSNIDASGIFNVDGDTTDLRAGDATNYLFDNTGATSYRMVAYLKSGNDVYNVTDYVTTPTQDATGKAFNLTSLGKATSGKDMKVKEFYLYDRELVGTDLDYFFYLRSDTGDILTNAQGEPLLPS